jgi:hypothetical protein
MAQSQTFSIRNIVKKEALPRIIFSSFYIYMHVDGGELVIRADSWVVWWESARKLSRFAPTKCVRRYGWIMPSPKVHLFLFGVGGTDCFCRLWFSFHFTVPHCIIFCLDHSFIHSFIHSVIHSVIHSFIHSMLFNEGQQAWEGGEIRTHS